MADYWKSTGKWYCELCKCWTGDNKASIEFHERGKRHAEAKKRKIIEAKRDAIGKRKQDEKDAGMFAKMEREALKAVQKDVAAGTAGRGDMKNIAASQSGAKEETFGIDTYPWSVMDTPQGFKYYYNSLTGESTWIVPEVFKKIEQEKKKKENAVQAPSSPVPSTSTITTEQKPVVEQHDVHPLLGGWSTVKHHSAPLQPVVKEPERNEGVVGSDEQTAVPSTATAEGDVQSSGGGCSNTPPVREKGKKFKEKVLSTTGLSSAMAESEPVAFKKRKSGNKNVRRRNDDD